MQANLNVVSHCREINKAGLSGLYETILETAGPEIKQALEVVFMLCTEQSLMSWQKYTGCRHVTRQASLSSSACYLGVGRISRSQ